MSSRGEPRDAGLITPDALKRLIKIKPSIKELFVRSWNKVLFAIERLDDFSRQAASVSGWLPLEGATAKELADDMLKKCGQKRYYVILNREDRLLWVGCFFDLLLQNAVSSYLPLTPVKWFDATRFVHEQDPMIRAQAGVTAIFSENDVVEVATDFGRFRVSWHALNSFFKRVGASQLVGKGQVEYKPSMKRNALLLLIGMFRASQPVERENRLTQMLKHGCRPADYRSRLGWIFVIADGALITCYEKGEIAKCGYAGKGKNGLSEKSGVWKRRQKRWLRKKQKKEMD